jgi:hypothetical protein
MRRTRIVGASIGVLLLAGVTAAAALAVKPKAGTWTGPTSQSLPISSPALTFQVSAGGKTIVNFEPTFEGRCTKSGSPPMTSPVITTDAGRNLPIKHSKFHASASNGRIHSGSVTLATASDQLHGKFTSKKTAKGTYSVTFKFNNNAAKYGLAGYTCKTGIVSWTATIA